MGKPVPRRLKRPPRPTGVNKLARDYERDINAQLNLLQGIIREELSKVLEEATGQAEARLTFDAGGEIIGQAFEQVEVKFLRDRSEEKLNAFILAQAQGISSTSMKNFQGTFQEVLGINVLSHEPWLTDEITEFMRENSDLIESIETEHLTDVRQMVLRSVKSGAAPSEIGKELSNIFTLTKARGKLIARDQTNKFHARLNELRFKNQGITRYRWRTVGGSKVRSLGNSSGFSDHQSLDGQIFSFDNPPQTVFKGKRAGETNNPGEDIQCLPGDSQIEVFGNIEILYRRRYSGKLTKLITDTGKVLRATPNHPILTANGWKSIGLINEGDYVIEGSLQGIDAIEQNVNNLKPTIQEVFDTFFDTFVSVSSGGITSQFHGDGTNEEVDIINTTGILPNEFDALTGKESCKLLLTIADEAIPDIFLGGVGTFELMFKSLFLAPDSIVRGMSKLLTLFGGQLGHSDEICSTAIAYFYLALNQAFGDNSSAHSIFFGEEEDTSPGKIIGDNGLNIKIFSIARNAVDNSVGVNPPGSEGQTQSIGVDVEDLRDIFEHFALIQKQHRIVEKVIGDFDIHVYNLQTDLGWYLNDSIITKNCRCFAEPIFEDLIRERAS